MKKRAFLPRAFLPQAPMPQAFLIIELVVALGVATFLFSIVTKFQKNAFILERESRKRLLSLKHKIAKRERHGFTLIEIVIYISLLLIFSFFLIGIEKNIRDFSLLSHNSTDKILREELLFDVIWRDVVCASPHVSEWDEENFLFKKQDKYVGFEAREGEIARCERKGRNKKRYTSIIWSGQNLKHVPMLSCKLDSVGVFVRGITVKFRACVNKGVEQHWYIKLRNGPLRYQSSRS
jgi:hypothetical protein